jgi:benzoyl-CoA reductase/2-hydroxyglutaryl-CoA dehydratase subunit BcrC/BadD/HgdB
MRFFNKVSEKKLLEIVKILKKSRTKTVEIYLKDFKYNYNQFKALLNSDSRINIIVHSSCNHNYSSQKDRIFFIEDKIEETIEEVYSENLFISNIPFFCESQLLNVGLNKKVCIDSKGNIKNYIDHRSSFGNIKSTLLKIRDCT